MDFIFSDDQELLRDSVRRMLAARAGPKRLREIWTAPRAWTRNCGVRGGLGTSRCSWPRPRWRQSERTGPGDAVVLGEEWSGRARAFHLAKWFGLAISDTARRATALLPGSCPASARLDWCFAEADAGLGPVQVGPRRPTRSGFDRSSRDEAHVERRCGSDFSSSPRRPGGTSVQILVPADPTDDCVDRMFDRPQQPPAWSPSTGSGSGLAVLPAPTPGAGRMSQIASVLICADSVGGATYLELTVDYAKQREQFGAGSPPSRRSSTGVRTARSWKVPGQHVLRRARGARPADDAALPLRGQGFVGDGYASHRRGHPVARRDRVRLGARHASVRRRAKANEHVRLTHRIVADLAFLRTPHGRPIRTPDMDVRIPTAPDEYESFRRRSAFIAGHRPFAPGEESRLAYAGVPGRGRGAQRWMLR